MLQSRRIPMPVNDQSGDLRLRRVISSCLSGMIVLLIMMFISDYIRLGIGGDFSSLKTDPGIPGLWMLTVLICLNLFAQVSIQATEAKAVKVFVVGFSGFSGLFFLGHQFVHLRSDGFGPDVHILLDASHHILAIIALWSGIKWMKVREAQ
jgi:hypothetical protein